MSVSRGSHRLELKYYKDLNAARIVRKCALIFPSIGESYCALFSMQCPAGVERSASLHQLRKLEL